LSTYIELLISGLVLGSIYALMSVGLTLIYGITKVLNYAQGSLFTLTAYLAFVFFSNFVSMNYFVVFFITLALMAVIGFVFEKIFIRPVRRLPGWDFTVIIVTLGTALLIDNLFLVIFGPLQKTLPRAFEGSLVLGAFRITKHNLFIIVAALLTIVILDRFLSKTRVGMSMRAVAQSSEGARIVGLDVDKVFGYSFATAGVLAGIAGILLTPRTLIYPLVGWPVFQKGLVVMVFGGLGSIKGTLYAAFILGMVEIIISYVFGARWALPVFIIILIVVLVFRPKGLAGRWQ
jgi:branched-chain amino acid transport system permease protein